MKYHISKQNTNLATNSSNQTKPASSLLKCKSLLLLALPLTLAAGCAYDSHSTSQTDYFRSSVVSQEVHPLNYSEKQEKNNLIGKKIFEMYMADANLKYPIGITVDNDGLVTLSGLAENKAEGQRFVDQVWTVAGVTRVQNEHGVYLASTAAPKNISLR